MIWIGLTLVYLGVGVSTGWAVYLTVAAKTETGELADAPREAKLLFALLVGAVWPVPFGCVFGSWVVGTLRGRRQERTQEATGCDYVSWCYRCQMGDPHTRHETAEQVYGIEREEPR